MSHVEEFLGSSSMDLKVQVNAWLVDHGRAKAISLSVVPAGMGFYAGFLLYEESTPQADQPLQGDPTVEVPFGEPVPEEALRP